MIVVCICGFIMFIFDSALTQEKNTITILSCVMKLEIWNRDYEQVADEDHNYRYISKNMGGESRNDVVKNFMLQKGWDFKEQMGSALIFHKNDRTITVGTRQFSKHYFLWDVPKEIFN